MGQVYYGTQVDVHPPTFVLFVNDPDLFDSTYRRYLENRFREVLPIPEVPMRIFFKARERSPAKSGPSRCDHKSVITSTRWAGGARAPSSS